MSDSNRRARDGDYEQSVVTLTDGSLYYSGFVTQSDGTQAAEYERHMHEGHRINGSMRTEHEKVFVPSNDAITEEASQQVRLYKQGPISSYRPSSQAAGN